MSRQVPHRRTSGPLPSRLVRRTPLASIPEVGHVGRRSSIPGAIPISSGQKAQRSTKTSQKLVVLPSEPQTRPIPSDLEAGDDAGELVSRQGARDYKSAGERMSKVERNRAGFKRLTAYCISESFRMKLLAAFLKRYGPNVNIRSSAPSKRPGSKSLQARLTEAEENGYEGSYFASSRATDHISSDGFIPSSSPLDERSTAAPDTQRPRTQLPPADEHAEVVFFAYGVVMFFGMNEGEERSIIEDLENANVLLRKFEEDDWEVEQCHFVHDADVAYPRIYNDLFTLKSHSHLLKLSIAHAIAQSTLLAHYETKAHDVLSDPRTNAIPRKLASTGELSLRRRDALKLTGRLFKLRRDVNLVSNVLDVPELFWSEASLKDLYDAVREYLEISSRVQVLNERLAVASDLLDLIHGHLNNSAMERITWIIIWLIVVACLVEAGEVMARLVVHAPSPSRQNIACAAVTTAPSVLPLLKPDALHLNAITEQLAVAGTL